MHYLRSVINKVTLDVPAPFEIVADEIDEGGSGPDTLDNIIEIDEQGTFIGRVSPHQIDLIVDILTDAGLM